ncbi:zinc-alpha-2-glycoprotein-like [Labeo rohita]|uniref:zinc-alpha-2-glycoprotein-like n=1 Tax=Labeo rohita TaxID=84645 RepID=UPI0021E25DEE|nr:zinc-alpha-2-glycoprotein-like [Labeo rohita]
MTRGDLLPNDDRMNQMRKSLEISAADKHKYTCSVTHLGNKWDTDLGSHSLWVLITHIEGETPFPAFSGIFMLDDIIVGYYNSETMIYVVRGNTTSEDDVVDPDHLDIISENVLVHIKTRSKYLRSDNHTESKFIFQIMSHCEQGDNEKPGQMITKTAFRGSAVDELRFFNGTFTYQSSSNYTAMEIKPYLELSMWHLKILYYPACIKMMKNYLTKRGTQVNRIVKPRVRLIQKTSSDYGGFCVSCLATGFYPRHINLTLFRDGQPVAEHEITGGDLLPSGDGTYQMRKSLEISAADKHKYTCSATHLSLDNKLDVTLEFDPGEPFILVIPSVLIILALVLLFGTGVGIYKCRKRQAGLDVYQTLVVCELLDLDKPGKMLIKDAVGGSTTDELFYFNNTFTYTVSANITQEVLKPHRKNSSWKLQRRLTQFACQLSGII